MLSLEEQVDMILQNVTFSQIEIHTERNKIKQKLIQLDKKKKKTIMKIVEKQFGTPIMKIIFSEEFEEKKK